jgi:hypothetical protein
MKRLVDEAHPSGSAEHLLAEAVRATPRLEPQPFEMQRVLGRVGRAARHGRVALLRVAVAAAVLLLAIAATAAVALRARGTRPALPPATSLAPTSAPSAAPLASPTLPAATAPPEPSTEVASPPSPASVALPSTRVSAAPKSGEDPTQVLQAIRALRHSGDPARASALLAQYLSTHPHGVLSEDALALSIEAALARHDPRSAADIARRYLGTFPTGRYRAFALQATQPPR